MGEINYDEFTANFAVVGVGGCGSNQVNRIYNNGIRSAETIAVNTDAKHLSITNAHKKLLIGKEITRGMGAGGYPEVAVKAAQSSASAIKEAIKGYDMVFITAGMGGGTGGGAAPVIAEMAKEQGSLVVAFVTYPFGLERSRKAKANWSIEQLTKNTDTTIIIENDRLLSYYSNLPMEKAFEIVDNITANAVRGITDTIKFPSLINLDFADVRSVMSNSGSAVINIGVGSGNDRIEHAIKSTISHPLMGYDIEGAKSALIHVSGGSNLTIKEATRLGEGVTESLDEKSNVIFGARLEPEANDKVYVMSIVTGVTPRLGEVKLYKEESSQMDYNVENI
ncbi:cell division protein FtsZ [Candidatus Marsarchaeota archaeon]|nr:cell division protein FtsZ [Candidatus Marsarchaeota archaeon]MCL5089774.1 cell division protein FtsZ [Candidatus Marsarchaeota archaeon]